MTSETSMLKRHDITGTGKSSHFSIGVVAFQGDIEENLAATRNAVKNLELEATVEIVRYPEEMEKIDGLILPGGESTVISTLASLKSSLPVIKRRVEEGLPVLGTCAGMIMLSRRTFDHVVGETKQRLLGNLDIVIERNAFGRQNDSFEAEISIPQIGNKPFNAVFIRAPAVSEVGSGVEVLAKFGGRTVAVKQRNIIGTSFHPELSDDSRIHEEFVKMCRAYANPKQY